MTGSIPPPNPLTYEGQVVVPFIQRPFPPQTSFNKFPVPTLWIDPLNMNAYIQVAKPNGVANWILLGGASGDLSTITTPDSVVVSPVAGNINLLNGTGMTITGSGDNITFNSKGGGLAWSVVTGTTQTAAVNHGYIANNAAGVAFTIPATASVGDLIAITTIHAGGFSVLQNAGQRIQIGRQNTTLGVGGSLASTHIGDTVFLLCTVANTGFLVIDMVGDITYV